jgi:RNA polymerase sigma-70 factor (ECF subfamily)
VAEGSEADGEPVTPEIDRQQRARLVSIAYRLLGSSHDAEDAVHEGLLRWHQLPLEQRHRIREPLAWLTRVVSRICLDHLKSARVRRESYRGIWLPEPDLDTDASASTTPRDPADAVSLDEAVSFALLVALEKLTPAERVSFILHDVFSVPFAEIAETVGRTPGACRQLATSARRSLESQARFDVQSRERDAVVQAFISAARGGDLSRLVGMLDPGVTSLADGGNRVNTARRPIVGAQTVAQYLLGVMAAQRKRLIDPQLSREMINGHSGVAIRDHGRLVGTIDLAITNGRIARIAIQVNEDKLQGSGT